MLSEIRRVFLATASTALEVVEHPAVSSRWAEPSLLTGYTVGGLAAHLCRAVSTPLGYLDQEADGRSVDTDAAGYFLEALGDHDPVDSALHRSVRQRSDDMAASGPLSLADATREALRSLKVRLEVEPSERAVVVLGGLTMLLDEYLETRVVELVVHSDDLAATCPEFGDSATPESAWTVARSVVVELAARRVGDRGLVLGLSRAERTQRPLAF